MQQSATLLQTFDFTALLEAQKKPAISVFGLGYVGAVSMACLAHLGHSMIGVDLDARKVAAVAAGQAPFVEEGLEGLLAAGVEEELIQATDNADWAVKNTDISFISVGTPTDATGGCDVSAIQAVSRAIGAALRDKDAYHLVVLRCSVPPGTTMGIVAPEIERASGKKLNREFGLCFNPEFLREGTAVADFHAPPKTVIGASDPKAGALLAEVYAQVDEAPIPVSIAAAEMVKYADNVWHATKVCFANEIGRLCKRLEVDSHEVMETFVQDTKLNLSPYYLKPGFAFGGSCLPKEVRAVQHLGANHHVDLPLINSLLHSNERQILEACELIEELGAKRIGFLGVSFKAGTDDLRESPTLELMAMLDARGYDISCFDPNLCLHDNGAEHYAYMRHAKPHLQELVDKLPETARSNWVDLVSRSDVVVVSHATAAFREAVEWRWPNTQVVDLVRLYKQPPTDPRYHGIAW